MPQSRPDSMIRTPLTARLLKPVLFAVLLLCLCLAGLVLLNTGADLDAALGRVAQGITSLDEVNRLR